MRNQADHTRQQAAVLLLVCCVWLLTTGVVSVVQMQVNDDAVEAWRQAVELRRNAQLPTEAPRDASQISKFISDAKAIVEERRRTVGKTLSEVQIATKVVLELKTKAEAAVRRGIDMEEIARHQGADALARDRWMEIKGRRAMRVSCSPAREAETHLEQMMHRLTLHVERQSGVTVDQVRLVAEQREVDELIHRLETTVDHLESKMKEISVLWPQWFDEAHDEAPITKGLFAADAEEYPTSPQGRQEFQAHVAALGGVS